MISSGPDARFPIRTPVFLRFSLLYQLSGQKAKGKAGISPVFLPGPVGTARSPVCPQWDGVFSGLAAGDGVFSGLYGVQDGAVSGPSLRRDSPSAPAPWKIYKIHIPFFPQVCYNLT